jgi:hypothetical protein
MFDSANSKLGQKDYSKRVSIDPMTSSDDILCLDEPGRVLMIVP